LTLGIEKTETQPRQRAEAEIVRGAAPDPEEYADRTLRGGLEQLTRTDRCRLPRIALRRGEQRESAGDGHLDHGDLVVVPGQAIFIAGLIATLSTFSGSITWAEVDRI
jgi:uncharacterized protein with PhoU and TrkA domain